MSALEPKGFGQRAALVSLGLPLAVDAWRDNGNVDQQRNAEWYVHALIVLLPGDAEVGRA